MEEQQEESAKEAVSISHPKVHSPRAAPAMTHQHQARDAPWYSPSCLHPLTINFSREAYTATPKVSSSIHCTTVQSRWKNHPFFKPIWKEWGKIPTLSSKSSQQKSTLHTGQEGGPSETWPKRWTMHAAKACAFAQARTHMSHPPPPPSHGANTVPSGKILAGCCWELIFLKNRTCTRVPCDNAEVFNLVSHI